MSMNDNHLDQIGMAPSQPGCAVNHLFTGGITSVLEGAERVRRQPPFYFHPGLIKVPDII